MLNTLGTIRNNSVANILLFDKAGSIVVNVVLCECTGLKVITRSNIFGN